MGSQASDLATKPPLPGSSVVRTPLPFGKEWVLLSCPLLTVLLLGCFSTPENPSKFYLLLTFRVLLWLYCKIFRIYSYCQESLSYSIPIQKKPKQTNKQTTTTKNTLQAKKIYLGKVKENHGRFCFVCYEYLSATLNLLELVCF